MTQPSDSTGTTGSTGSTGDDALGRIAVIGFSGRFPGAASPAELWENLRNGVESVRALTDEDLRAAGVDEALIRDPAYVKAAARLQGIELFDAGFFGINPREAELTDPQHRVLLECAWEALEDAGHDPARFPGSIGVFAGSGRNHYLREHLLGAPDLLAAMGPVAETVGAEKDFVATRVSYELDLRGPSVSVQTACSTSLVAVHLGCQSLLAGECDMVLAGGVSITGLRDEGYLYVDGGIFSSDGHLRAFDAAADGQIGGNGVALVVLRRLADALRDGDDVRAVLLGSAIGNDGAQKVGFTAPGVEGQARVVVEALEVAGVDPATVTYVEAHGTGTRLGDPIEVRALTEAFRTRTSARGFCALGSLKTNVGHLDAAAGTAGLIKTVLALQHRELPPSLHFRVPNPEIDFAASPFRVQAALAPWNAPFPRRAGVSSFGMGGTNAHVVVEEAPARPPSLARREEALLLVSAKGAGACEAAAARLAEHLERHPEQSLADVAWTTQVGRAAFAHRRAVVARTAAEAAAALRAPAQLAHVPSGAAPPPVAFLFPGQGAQHAGMARGAYEREPVLRETLDRVCELFRPHLGRDLRELLFPDPGLGEEADALLADTRWTQPALFAVELALAELWRSWGVVPAALAGHSIGELVAATVAEVFTLPDAVRLVAARGRLVAELPGGAMLAVHAGERELDALPTEGLDLAAVNGPELCVLSGPEAAVQRLEAELERRGVGCRRLHTSHAFHSRLVEGAVEPFRRLVAEARPGAPRIPIVACATGRLLSDAEARDPDTWAAHLRRPVRFADAAAALLATPGQVLLEVGPGTTLSTLAGLVLRDPGAAGAGERALVHSLPHPRAGRASDLATLAGAAGRLWCAGVPVDWDGYHAGERLRRVPLPTYPFERERYWIERAVGAPAAAPGPSASATPLARRKDVADWLYAPTWKRVVRAAAGERDPAGETWLVVAESGDLAAPLAAALRARGARAIVARPGPALAEEGCDAFRLPSGDAAAAEELLGRLADQEAAPSAVVHLDVAPAAAVSVDASEALERGFWGALALAQALAERPAAVPVRFTAVTAGAHDVLGDEPLRPAAVLATGVVRAAAAELAHVAPRAIDLDPAEPDAPPRRAARLLAELLRGDAGGAERLVALRRGHAWVPDHAPVRLAAPGEGALPAPLRAGAVVLVTGGLGGIGLALARGLARLARAKLVLVGRGGLPDRGLWDAWLAGHDAQDPTGRRIGAVRELEALGAEVLVEAADVADPAALRGVLERARRRFGRIDGVVHAAGVPGGGMLQLRTREAAAAVLAPKVRGTVLLDELLREDEPAFVVLCSSLATLVDGVGQVDYFAANAFLDAFARAAARRGGPAVVSIGWDAWRDVGMAAETDVPEALRAERAANLARGIGAEEGVDVLLRVLGAGLPHVLVSTVELGARLAAERPAAPGAVEESQPAAAAPARAARRQAHGRPELATAFVPPAGATETAVAELWAELLGIDRVGRHDDFFALGGNSLLLMQVSSRLRATLGVTLALRVLFDTPDVASLAERIDALRLVQEVGSPRSAGGTDPGGAPGDTDEFRL